MHWCSYQIPIMRHVGGWIGSHLDQNSTNIPNDHNFTWLLPTEEHGIKNLLHIFIIVLFRLQVDLEITEMAMIILSKISYSFDSYT